MKLEDLADYPSRSVAIIGGTFNPIHYGHLLLAERAREQYNLDLVLFVPNRLSPLKEADRVAEAEDRYVMVELAVVDNPCFVACRCELDRPSPSYSIDTIRALHQILPAQPNIFFLSGADAILELPDWHKPDAILAEARVIAAPRPGFDLGMIASTVGKQAAEKIDILPMPAIDISSTDIRQRVRRGKSLRYLTPAPVIDYIYKRGLYGSSQQADSDVWKQ